MCFKLQNTWYLISSSSWGLSLQGSPQRNSGLHITLSSASSSLTPVTFMFSFTTSINLLFGLLPGSLKLRILLPISSLFLLWTCLNNLSLATVLYTFLFTLAETITPDTFLPHSSLYVQASSPLFHSLHCSGLLTRGTLNPAPSLSLLPVTWLLQFAPSHSPT